MGQSDEIVVRRPPGAGVTPLLSAEAVAAVGGCGAAARPR